MNEMSAEMLDELFGIEEIPFSENLRKLTHNNALTFNIDFECGESPAAEFKIIISILYEDNVNDYMSVIKPADQSNLLMSLSTQLKSLFAAFKQNTSLVALTFRGNNDPENEQMNKVVHFTLAMLLAEKMLENKGGLTELIFEHLHIPEQTYEKINAAFSTINVKQLVLYDLNLSDVLLSDILFSLYNNAIKLLTLNVLSNPLTEDSFINILNYFHEIGCPREFVYAKNTHSMSQYGMNALVSLLRQSTEAMELSLIGLEIDDVAIAPLLNSDLTIRKSLKNCLNLSNNCLSNVMLGQLIEFGGRHVKGATPLKIIAPNQAANKIIAVCHYGSEDEVNKLLQSKSIEELLAARDTSGNSVLHLLAFQGYVSALEYFADKGADLNIANHDQQTPFLYAFHDGKKECIQWFTQRGALNNIVNSNQFFFALAGTDSIEIFDGIYAKLPNKLKKKMLQVQDGFTFLHQLTYCGSIKLLEYCLQKPEFYAVRNKRMAPQNRIQNSLTEDTKAVLITPLMYVLDAPIDDAMACKIIAVFLNYQSMITSQDIQILEKDKAYVQDGRCAILQFHYLNELFQKIFIQFALKTDSEAKIFHLQANLKNNIQSNYNNIRVNLLLHQIEKLFREVFQWQIATASKSNNKINISIFYDASFSKENINKIYKALQNYLQSVKEMNAKNKKINVKSKSITQSQPKTSPKALSKKQTKAEAKGPENFQAQKLELSYQVALSGLTQTINHANVAPRPKAKSNPNPKFHPPARKNQETKNERKRRQAEEKRQLRAEKQQAKKEQQERNRARVADEKAARNQYREDTDAADLDINALLREFEQEAFADELQVEDDALPTASMPCCSRNLLQH